MKILTAERAKLKPVILACELHFPSRDVSQLYLDVDQHTFRGVGIGTMRPQRNSRNWLAMKELVNAGGCHYEKNHDHACPYYSDIHTLAICNPQQSESNTPFDGNSGKAPHRFHDEPPLSKRQPLSKVAVSSDLQTLPVCVAP